MYLKVEFRKNKLVKVNYTLLDRSLWSLDDKMTEEEKNTINYNSFQRLSARTF